MKKLDFTEALDAVKQIFEGIEDVVIQPRYASFATIRRYHFRIVFHHKDIIEVMNRLSVTEDIDIIRLSHNSESCLGLEYWEGILSLNTLL
jgi:hypothetical protein